MKMEKLRGRGGGGGGDNVKRARVVSEKAVRSGGRGGVMEAVGGGGRRGGRRRGNKLASAVNEGFGGGGVVDEIAGVGGVGRSAERRAGAPPRIRPAFERSISMISCCSNVVDEGGIDRANQNVRNRIGFMSMISEAQELRLLRGAAIASTPAARCHGASLRSRARR
ncbi:hypothetical protein L7F22_043248 [Adiantum nelumboides]|nr:hypothetical protein [Adiantum nelumboides]